MELQIQRQTHSFFTDIKHTVQYDTWEQFLQNEPILKKIWNEFSPFSWSFHPNSNSILQIAWISMQEFSGDLPTSSPIRKLQSYLEIRVIEIKVKESDTASIHTWIQKNTPGFWPLPT